MAIYSGFMWIFPLKMVIFHCYVSSPEGMQNDEATQKPNLSQMSLEAAPLRLGSYSSRCSVLIVPDGQKGGKREVEKYPEPSPRPQSWWSSLVLWWDFFAIFRWTHTSYLPSSAKIYQDRIQHKSPRLGCESHCLPSRGGEKRVPWLAGFSFGAMDGGWDGVDVEPPILKKYERIGIPSR